MKTSNPLRPFLTIASFATMLAWLPQPMVAENKPPLPVESAKSGYDLEIKDERLLNAPKGRGAEATLGNVVDALRDRYPKANLVMAPGLAKLKISELKLRAGHLADELEAIRVASGAKFDWMGPGFAGPNNPPMQGIDPTTGLPIATNPTESNTGLFVLREPVPTPETARTVEAFNIDPYLRWLRENQDANETKDSREEEVVKRLNELEKIVVVALESLKPGSSVEMPTFQFHRGANLLVVVGTGDAVDVARKVVNALPGQTGFGSSGGGGGRSFGGVGGPGMSPEAQEAFRQRYGLPPRPGRPVQAPAPAAPPAPIPPR